MQEIVILYLAQSHHQLSSPETLSKTMASFFAFSNLTQGKIKVQFYLTIKYMYITIVVP